LIIIWWIPLKKIKLYIKNETDILLFNIMLSFKSLNI
jgi:hypothetical protein